MPNDFEPAERGLRDHVGVWRRRLLVIVLVTAVGGGAALATSLLQPKRYQAAAVVLIPVEPAGQPGQNGAQVHFDPNRVVQTEAAFATADQVRKLAENKTGGADATVAARGAKDSDLLTITATASTGDQAATVANAFADAYVALRHGTDASGIKGVQVITPATAPTTPSSPTTVRNVVLGLLAGLVLGLAGAYAVDHFDDTIRSEHDLARLSGLPVLGQTAPPPDGPVALVGATDDRLAGSTTGALLERAGDASVLVVRRGARGRTARQAATVLHNVGVPVAGAVLGVDDAGA